MRKLTKLMTDDDEYEEPLHIATASASNRSRSLINEFVSGFVPEELFNQQLLRDEEEEDMSA